jgi:hypothetical protein
MQPFLARKKEETELRLTTPTASLNSDFRLAGGMRMPWRAAREVVEKTGAKYF